ncbi:MAG: RNA 2',3'-cyclic phosphodiesterase [bacterium]|nr:RNA 2',3'-cyclic phosphodiesterase [bacterium]
MRVFVGVDLPPELKHAIMELLQPYLRQIQGKHVEKENLHITLKFYGDITPAQLEIVKKILDESVKDLQPAEIIIKGVGAFPSPANPRVLWLGVQGPGALLLKELFLRIEIRSQKHGLRREEHEYTPHVTVSRLKAGGRAVQKFLEELQEQVFGKFIVTKITVFKSTLTPRGPIYEKLAETEL